MPRFVNFWKQRDRKISPEIFEESELEIQKQLVNNYMFLTTKYTFSSLLHFSEHPVCLGQNGTYLLNVVFKQRRLQTNKVEGGL